MKKVSKRFNQDSNYSRPEKTYQESLSNQEIKEKLKDYKKISDIKTISIGNHIRYFTTNLKTKEKYFRMGGSLNKIDPEGRYIILSNGKLNWSVQILNSTFFQKMNDDEIRDELKKEIKKEILSEENNEEFSTQQSHVREITDMKKEIGNLTKKLESIDKDYKGLIKENENLIKENENLNQTIITIQKEIKKEKLKDKQKEKK